MKKQRATTSSSEPRRPLRSNFTAQTLGLAIAKSRSKEKYQSTVFMRGKIIMKSLKFMRTIPGLAIGLAVVTTGTVSAHALTNWFSGDVTVKQDETSVLSVDLSQCKGMSLPGFDSPGKNVQFKVLKQPAPSASELQQKLLAECEYQTVKNFYKDKIPAAFGEPHFRVGQADPQYHFGVATVKAVNANTITLDYAIGGTGKSSTKTFNIASDATVFNQGNAASTASLQAGDTVMFATFNAAEVPKAGDDVFEGDGMNIVSIFKTQYDLKQAPYSIKYFYEKNNIQPLDIYNQLNKGVKSQG